MPGDATLTEENDRNAADGTSDVSSSGEEGQVYDVEAVEGERGSEGSKEYYIKWKGYDRKHNTWEPRENLLQCAEALRTWEKRQHREQEKPKGKKRTASERDDHSESYREHEHLSSETAKNQVVVVRSNVKKPRDRAADAGRSSNHQSVDKSDRASRADSAVSDAATDQSAEFPIIASSASNGKSKSHTSADRSKTGNGKAAKASTSRKQQNGKSAKKNPVSQKTDISEGGHSKARRKSAVARNESPEAEIPVPISAKKPGSSAKHNAGKDTFRKPRPVSGAKTSNGPAKRKKELSINRKGVECASLGIQTEQVDDDPLTCPIPPELAKEANHVEELRSKALRVLRIQGILPRSKAPTRPLDTDDALVMVVLDEGGGKEAADIFTKRVVRFVLPLQLIEFYEGHLTLPVSSQNYVPLNESAESESVVSEQL